MEELLKAPLHVHGEWLFASALLLSKQKEERQFITQHLVFSIVSSLSTMRRSSPYVQT
jgi:hypothetical protein